MPLTCNIDAKGKRARFIFGAILIVAGGTAAALWAAPGGGWKAWTTVGLLLFWGGFAVFEARAGWCAVRAMGFKTPM